MPYAEIYNLTVFDADTKQELFHWLNVAAKDHSRPAARDTISHEGQNWVVIGVLYDSTATDWKVDVKKNG
jgi:hypothetical protein